MVKMVESATGGQQLQKPQSSSASLQGKHDMSAAKNAGWRYADEAPDEVGQPFKRLSRKEARQLAKSHPVVSPWTVLGGQAIAGLVVAVVAWGVTGAVSVGWSALYGALAVVVPGAIFARGLMGKVASANPGAAVVGFFVWEAVKVGLSIAMLFAAPRMVPNLSWPALLVGLVVTLKVVWLVVFLQHRLKSEAQLTKS